ncbi:SMP-30/gluconolactonase/LRE family protein [Microbacterium sp. NPDC057650]|uniref:SMP-30/gluconolactonase/LRE family protein n=1 Tax=unclassified Microbacterium TaxID=2609290 RepID=UPI00366F6106
MTDRIDVVVPARAACGEGPYWDPRDGSVVWVDIVGRQIHRTDSAGSTTTIDYPEMVGAAAPRAGGGLVLAVESGFALVDDAGAVTSTVDVLAPPIRMNDAKVDPQGNYWAGSCAMDFSAGRGGLWRLGTDLAAELVVPDLTQPNGIGWSPDGRTMYLVETQDRLVLAFDFDPDAATVTDRGRVLAEGFVGFPDGLSIDAEGHIWLAEYGGRAVHELSETGRTLRTVDIPTDQPTSCAFVGPQLDRLWVTSAAAGLDADPLAGSIFEIHGHGAHGLPVALFQG